MRKTPAVLTLLFALAIAGAAPLLQAQSGAGGVSLTPSSDDFPRRTAKAFAPFIRAIIMRRVNTAQQIFKVRRPVMSSLEQMETVRILSRFQKPDSLNLNLVGGRMLGQNIGILLFTLANEEGPIYFKIYYYGVDGVIYIDRMDISDDWDNLEAAAATIESLPAPVTVSLGGMDDTGQ